MFVMLALVLDFLLGAATLTNIQMKTGKQVLDIMVDSLKCCSISHECVSLRASRALPDLKDPMALRKTEW